jgi:hypothetical protein
VLVTNAVRCTALALVSLLGVLGCHRTAGASLPESPATQKQETAQNLSRLPSLKDAQNKLEDAIIQPASPFHLTYRKDMPDGYSCFYDVEISPTGIKGRERVVRQQAAANYISDSRSEIRALDGTPIGSNSWRFITNDLLTSLGSDLQYAEAGLKFAEDELSGGFDTRRYDFDLTDVEVGSKAVPVNAGLVSNSLPPQPPKYYSFKGSAWIAKDNGRLVKAQYDHVSTFANGSKALVHYDLSTTKQ